MNLYGDSGVSEVRTESVGTRVAGTVITPPSQGVRSTEHFVILPTVRYLRLDRVSDPFRSVAGRPWVRLRVSETEADRLANRTSIFAEVESGLLNQLQGDAAIGSCLNVLQRVSDQRGAHVAVRDGGRVERIGPMFDGILGALTHAGTFVLTLVGGRPTKLTAGHSTLTFATPAHLVITAPPVAETVSIASLKLRHR